MGLQHLLRGNICCNGQGVETLHRSNFTANFSHVTLKILIAFFILKQHPGQRAKIKYVIER